MAFVLRDDDDRLLVARRPDTGLLGGLWEFPIAPDESVPPGELLLRALGLQAWDLAAHEPVVHLFSHLRLVVAPITGRATGAMHDAEGRYDTWQWMRPDHLVDLPTSRLMGKLMAAISTTR